MNSMLLKGIILFSKVRYWSVLSIVQSFWPFLEGRICEEDMERLHVLRYVDSDVRKCKVWSTDLFVHPVLHPVSPIIIRCMYM